MDELKKFHSKTHPKILEKSIMFFAIVLVMSIAMYFINKYGGIGFSVSDFETIYGDIVAEDGTISVLQLILNNIVVGLVAILIGIIPFIYLPWWLYFINALLAGIVVGTLAPSLPAVFLLFIFGILPHGIFETPAICICVALGVGICNHLSKAIIGRSSPISFPTRLKNTFVAFFSIAMPLFIIGGLVEVFITSRILSLSLAFFL